MEVLGHHGSETFRKLAPASKTGIIRQSTNAEAGKEGSRILIADKGWPVEDISEKNIGRFVTDTMEGEEVIAELVPVLIADGPVVIIAGTEPIED